MLDAVSKTILLLFFACFTRFGKGQFPAFSDVHDFRLTSEVSFPSEGDDVKLRCMRTQPYLQKASSDFFGRNDGISWEQNEKPVYETSRGVDGKCEVKVDGRGIGRQDHGQSRDAKCEDDGVTVTLTLKSWTPTHVAGDVWRCLQFPFADSARLDIQSFVPATSVSITQKIIKRSATYPPRGDYPRTPGGTVVSCVTSPCRPPASVDWFVASPEEGDVKLTSHAQIEQQVNTSRQGLSSTTSDVILDQDTDHGLRVFCRASNGRQGQDQGQGRGGITSDMLGVVVKYPPSVRVRIEPSSSVLEGDDVTLVCSADGRPTPEVKWIRKSPRAAGVDALSLPDEEKVISVEEFVTLTSLGIVDSGEYRCVATNGLEPGADGTVVLYVRERPRPINNVASSDQGSADTPTQHDDDDNTGAVVGALFATLLVVACICVVLFLYVRHRRGKTNIGSSSQDIHLDDSDTGIYASCASLPRAPPPPPYTEVDRRNRKLSKVDNPGYGRSSSLIFGVDARRESNDGRPLPLPPDVYERYEEIDDNAVPGAYANDTSPYIEILDGDGYETPVDGYETPVSPGNNTMTTPTQPFRSHTTRASPSNRTEGSMATSTHPFRGQDAHNKSRAKTMMARPLRHYTNNKMARRAHDDGRRSEGSVAPRIDRRRYGTTVAPDIHYINNDFIDTQM